MSHLTETQIDRQTSRVLRPYTLLPEAERWDGLDREPWLAQLPDALAGLLRQFTSQVLDLGRLGFDDERRYAIYRGKVFDVRDALLEQLDGWLRFWGVTDADGRIRAAVRDALLEEA